MSTGNRSGGRRHYRTGISADAIIDSALSLTREVGLQAWSTRDLATRLDTSLSVLYRKFGDRAGIEAAVVERVILRAMPMSSATDWRGWLTDMLAPALLRLWPYPGVAEWTFFHGPALPSVIPTISRGIELLRDGGFGEDAPLAYSVAFNTVISEIALSDQRRTGRSGVQPTRADFVQVLRAPSDTEGHGPDGNTPPQHSAEEMATFIEQFDAVNPTGAGGGVPCPPDQPPVATSRYFAYLLDSVIAGLQHQLDARSENR
ncbi:TetR/AcrR family transcriptional regulator [Leucobacter luti]|uniref:TetR family transcriptional regulator n=1 Tax=Leucobacter luti TaxID=340320 RepID=A0A4R6RRK8_9MICO|nr:TetR/AcrR family transcriptional regulator [Leucobacter luti]QYM76128.1 TetR/AcrR family transcriptional regulator [Leucobacter luti]TDP89463.1 TetR family transcriptional regulator [Leucobacter luti]